MYMYIYMYVLQWRLQSAHRCPKESMVAPYCSVDCPLGSDEVALLPHI